MPLSNADNPAAEPVVKPAADAESAPESKAAKKAAAKAKAESEKPVLAKAFTSGNAEVHDLVAQREIAISNEDKKHLAEVDAKLAALGYEV
jgi:hypothetical protein